MKFFINSLSSPMQFYLINWEQKIDFLDQLTNGSVKKNSLTTLYY